MKVVRLSADKVPHCSPITLRFERNVIGEYFVINTLPNRKTASLKLMYFPIRTNETKK